MPYGRRGYGKSRRPSNGRGGPRRGGRSGPTVTKYKSGTAIQYGNGTRVWKPKKSARRSRYRRGGRY